MPRRKSIRSKHRPSPRYHVVTGYGANEQCCYVSIEPRSCRAFMRTLTGMDAFTARLVKKEVTR